MKIIRMSSYWLRVALLLSEISHSMAWKTKKLKSRTFIHDLHVSKAQAIRSFHKSEDADDDDIVFQMICKSDVSRLNVAFLI